MLQLEMSGTARQRLNTLYWSGKDILHPLWTLPKQLQSNRGSPKSSEIFIVISYVYGIRPFAPVCSLSCFKHGLQPTECYLVHNSHNRAATVYESVTSSYYLDPVWLNLDTSVHSHSFGFLWPPKLFFPSFRSTKHGQIGENAIWYVMATIELTELSRFIDWSKTRTACSIWKHVTCMPCSNFVLLYKTHRLRTIHSFTHIGQKI